MSGDTPLAHLNDEQRRAATLLWEKDIPALQLIAGAGSGKTTTLVAAIGAAVRAKFTASRLAVISFTRKSARELAHRLSQTGIAAGFCGTIHALAWRHLCLAGNPPRLITDTADLRANIIRATVHGLSHVPARLLGRTDFLSANEAARANANWQDYLSEQRLADFDSLVPLAMKLPDIDTFYDCVFIDEFQDTSPEQLQFALALKPKKLFVVGDDWQSIYRFRGADVSLTRDFLNLVPKAQRIFLVRNYRSQKHIVRLGNRAIRLSLSYVQKRLEATRSSAARPVLYLTAAAEMQTAWSRFRSEAHRTGKDTVRITVLVRTNAQRRYIEKNLPAAWQVMTIHKSKGLEFDHVLVFGIGEHNMPHRENDFDEEVRILYVAMTRARHFLGFIGWEHNEKRSRFLPFLVRHCRLAYF